MKAMILIGEFSFVVSFIYHTVKASLAKKQNCRLITDKKANKDISKKIAV
jgi:hypothetical protein